MNEIQVNAFFYKVFVQFYRDCAWRVSKALNVTKLKKNQNMSTQFNVNFQ